MTYNSFANMQNQTNTGYTMPQMGTTMNNGMTTQTPNPMNNTVSQQFGQPQRPSAIPGRFVNSQNEITPQEVPMDGSVGLFPMADGSCVYMKAWDNNGLIQTRRYVLEQETDQNAETSNPLDLVMQRLDKIESMLKKNSRPYHPNGKYNKNHSNQKSETGEKEGE